MEDTDKPIMTHLDEELTSLKSEIIEMWQMVISQLQKTREAMLEFDKDLAREVVAAEKRINSLFISCGMRALVAACLVLSGCEKESLVRGVLHLEPTFRISIPAVG